jgi:hypothetical protein
METHIQKEHESIYLIVTQFVHRRKHPTEKAQKSNLLGRMMKRGTNYFHKNQAKQLLLIL